MMGYEPRLDFPAPDVPGMGATVDQLGAAED